MAYTSQGALLWLIWQENYMGQDSLPGQEIIAGQGIIAGHFNSMGQGADTVYDTV